VTYAVGPDPYCYPGTAILENIPGLRDSEALSVFEAISSAERAEEPLPTGRFSVSHFRAIHHHLFQDVYRWAGKPRDIRIAKNDSMFCYPEHIESELEKLFVRLKEQNYLRGSDPREFAVGLASFLSDLNAIHAFREGNGRTQMVFVTILAAKAGHPLDLDRLDPAGFLEAMIASFAGDESQLSRQILSLIE